MPVAIGEPDNLVFNGRAIARTAAGDCAAVYCREVDVVANDAVCVGRSGCDAAGDLRPVNLFRQEAERFRYRIAPVFVQRLPVYRRSC